MDSILKNVAGADECMRDEWVLPNGLRVLGERLPHLRSVSIGAWMHVGSMMETPEENGLSHFIEHMIFKGTTKRTVRQDCSLKRLQNLPALLPLPRVLKKAI